MGYNLIPHQTSKSKDHYHFNKSHKIEKRITNLSTLVWYDLQSMVRTKTILCSTQNSLPITSHIQIGHQNQHKLIQELGRGLNIFYCQGGWGAQNPNPDGTYKPSGNSSGAHKPSRNPSGVYIYIGFIDRLHNLFYLIFLNYLLSSV